MMYKEGHTTRLHSPVGLLHFYVTKVLIRLLQERERAVQHSCPRIPKFDMHDAARDLTASLVYETVTRRKKMGSFPR